MRTRRNSTGQTTPTEGDVSRETQKREISYKYLMGLVGLGFVAFVDNQPCIQAAKTFLTEAPGTCPVCGELVNNKHGENRDGDTVYGQGHKEDCANAGNGITPVKVPSYAFETVPIANLTDLTKHQVERIKNAVDPAAEARKLIAKLKDQGLTSEQIAQMAQG